MKYAFKFSAMVAVALAAIAMFGGASQTATAQESTEQTAEQTQNQVVYSYEAQSGDSYTKIARKAVQTYGIINSVNLTEAGIVFAETNLTLAAGSPELEVGQKVEISEAILSEWVKKAQELTDTQQARWAVYARNVDFNTDAVGQTR